ncbi:glucodextranase DOMON-like domain-containing protein [Halomarina oriensis]|uniref:Glucoamylase n=1 Tax=Halomarina oriensis TaxID=671145 RepID=A0A6B0GJ98_9EURY|nr:glucodextranase DOMON-like domain-containing protein [Halomarina oriensis]MWG32903.1 glucoamylase [Halomarina oriensis]
MRELSRRDALTLLGAGALGTAFADSASAAPLPTGGIDATWTTGEQYGIGTVADHRSEDPSRVWFTLSEGALTGARFPRIDLMNLRTLDFLVTDGEGYAKRTHVVDRTAETTLDRTTVQSEDEALVFEQTTRETASERDWTLTVEYVADPDHDAVLADVRFEAGDGVEYDVYAVADLALSNSGRSDTATVRGSAPPSKGGGKGKGEGNGKRSGYVLTGRDTDANDDSAAFRAPDGSAYDTALALAARGGFDWATVDVVGGDALSSLLVDGTTATTYDEASGNVAMVGRLGSGSSLRETVGLGFAEGGDEEAASAEVQRALRRAFSAARARYTKTWRDYLADLDTPDAVAGDSELRAQYDTATMALKAADSKQFPGAGLASLSVPWGVGVTANEPSDYGYNFTWARDLYQAFSALLAAGDTESAREALAYIYEYQQDETGFVPQNTYVDGRTRWGGEQMDNISFPAIMAYRLREAGIGFEEGGYGYEHLKRSSDYVAANGPETGQERWEEESGLSPSTTAAEIAGLACAASIAADEGERADALVWLALADRWQRNTENWMATSTGDLADEQYYFRINDDRDPDDGAPRAMNNGGPTLDERNVADAGFLELVRLGVKPADDPVIRTSVDIVDDTIRVDTPNGPGWYRYNGDGYGEQDGSDNPAGAPWSLDNTGQGRLWPIFSGERAEYELLAGGGGSVAPDALLRSMQRFANSGRMIPEQVWDRPEPTAYNWRFGEGTGSATPLSWSMAQFVRLAHGIDAGEPVETPAFVRERYADGDLPEGPTLDVQFPPSVVGSKAVTVSGTTSGSEVVVSTGAETVEANVTDGAFSTEVAVADGETTVTVVASTGGDIAAAGTTVARSTVAYVDVGDPVAEFGDPEGDDAGPGGYTYPTNGVFVDGAFDLTSFGVYEDGDSYQFVTGLGTLTNPWGGNGLSLQTIQVYVRDPSASGGTTTARAGVNAQFTDPYQRRLVVEGFAQPVVEDASGSVVSRDVTVTGYQSVNAVKVEVPKAALGDLSGTELVPLVLGQDGYNTGGIRPVNAENGGYVFGGGRDDDANPNVVDLVTPEGVDQADALAYTATEQATIPYLPVE